MKVTPYRSSGTDRRNGEPTASGRTAAQTSWTNPGSVRASDRVPPPAVGSASWTTTERPAFARVIAAARPLGPEPTTTASGRSDTAIGNVTAMIRLAGIVWRCQYNGGQP